MLRKHDHGRNRHGLERLEVRQLLTLAPELVADINPAAGVGSNPNFLAATSDRLFFTATGGTGSCGIWSTDGTVAGTQEACLPGTRRWLQFAPGVAAGTGHLFYLAGDLGASWADELWVTDGTAESNTLLRTGLSPFHRLTVIGDQAYFRGQDVDHAIELWTSDGTVAGTFMIKDINPGSNNSSDPKYFAELNGLTYFAAVAPNGDSSNSNDLWVTDGTADGTHFVATNTSGHELNPQFITRVGDKIFFRGADRDSGYELWVSDGSTAGTHQVIDLAPGPAHSYPRDFVEFKGKLYFTATDATGTPSFWYTDGTEFGTARVNSPFANGGSVVANNLLFFGARASDEPRSSLWRTDGTPDGTFALPNPPGVYLGGGKRLAIAGMTFTVAPISNNHYGIWKTDGTADGTSLVAEYVLPIGTSLGRSFENVRNQIFFVNQDEAHGGEIWKVGPIPGDTNFDGLVDLADLNNVRNHFGDVGNVLGDANGDGVVDLVDLNDVRNHFGVSSGGAAVANVAPPVRRSVRATLIAKVEEPAKRETWQDALFVSSTGYPPSRERGAAMKLRAVDRIFAAY